MELFLLLNFIYGGEYLHSGKLVCSGGEFLLFLSKKYRKFRGIFALSVETNSCWVGDKKHCVSGGRDKEHGPKLFRLKPLLKVNISNNCTITDNYLDNYQDSINFKTSIPLDNS